MLLGLLEAGGRDAAWAAMTREAARRATSGSGPTPSSGRPTTWSAAPAAVLGLAAWLAGHGALAWCAVDRCQAVDPDNSLARPGGRRAHPGGAAVGLGPAEAG